MAQVHICYLERELAASVSDPVIEVRNTPAIDRKVAISVKAEVQIDVEAAKALINWKSLFADEVATRARQLAAESSQPERVTLSHYRHAAQVAVRSLLDAILGEEPSSDDHKAA